MKRIMIIAVLVLSAIFAEAQYTLYKSVDGVEFYTKWGHEKWWSRKSPKVLLVKVVNTTDHAVGYTIGIEFTKNLQVAEQGREETYCLEAGATSRPRVKGLMFQPGPAAEGYDSFELTNLEVETLVECAEK